MENEPIITAEGRKALEEKLEYLETTRRREVSEQMKRAVEHGDVSDNAEYDEARKAYLQLEKQINEVAGLIARSRVIADEEISTETVGIGSLVQIVNAEDDSDKKEIRIVGPAESDPGSGKISHMSPVGTSLMNAKLGEVVTVNTPGGTKKYKVVAINK